MLQVTWRGSPASVCGLAAEPQAVIAPEMTPSRGGNNVNGRVNRRYVDARLNRGPGYFLPTATCAARMMR